MRPGLLPPTSLYGSLGRASGWLAISRAWQAALKETGKTGMRSIGLQGCAGTAQSQGILPEQQVKRSGIGCVFDAVSPPCGNIPTSARSDTRLRILHRLCTTCSAGQTPAVLYANQELPVDLLKEALEINDAQPPAVGSLAALARAEPISATVRTGSGLLPASLTSALPTMTPSAIAATSAASAGVPMPKPTAR